MAEIKDHTKVKTGAATGKTLNNTGAGQPSRWLRGAYPLLWIAIGAFLLYGQTIPFQYTFLDDQNLVLFNLENLKTPAYVTKAFTEDVFHMPELSTYYYRPVMTLSFMADAMIGQGSFAMFHVSNIIYHILAVFLLFLFFTELGFNRSRSFIFSLIFLVHPALTQAVAWVPGRNDSLLAIFILASAIYGIRYFRQLRISDLALHLSFYILALLTKESAIVLPFWLLIAGLVYCRVPGGKYPAPLAGWIMITVTWAIVRNYVTGGEHSVPFVVQLLSALKNLPAVLPYLGKALLPFDLSVFPVMADMTLSLVFGIVFIGIILLLTLFFHRKHWFFLLAGLVWFLAFLLPSLVYMPGQVPNFSEHRIYIALAGILMVMINFEGVKTAAQARVPALPLAAGIILIFSILTFLHSRNFRDQFAFWHNAVETSPDHAFNYKNLGSMYVQAGDLAKAEPYLRKAIQINPAEPLANSDLGYVCVMTGRPADAEKYYLEEIRINPQYDHVHYNLGLLYLNNGHADAGIRELEKTISMNPYHAGAYKTLLEVYRNQNRPADYNRVMEMVKQSGVTLD
jgi:Tfp pilus assembly protein PilF